MNLGLVLAIGESFKDFRKKGQDKLLVRQNIKTYSESFNKVVIFSYEDEKYPLYKNNELVKNHHKIQKYLYSFLMPIINREQFDKCDIIRGLQITGGIPCLIAKIFYKKPFVINYGYDYEAVSKIEKKYLQAFLYKTIAPIIIKSADAVIVTTPMLAKKIKNIRTKNVFIVPNGVDVEKFKPTRNIRENKTKKIIFVGRLEPQKNLTSLIEAVSKVKIKNQLILVGQGSQKKKLLELSKKLKVDLKIIERVSHDELPKILRSVDVFVLPSLIEGHPKALLEAMSAGLACIGSNVDGIKEIISHNKNGILTGTNSEDITKAILYLIKNPHIARQFSQNARKYVTKNFDFEKLMSDEIKILKEVAFSQRR